MPLVPGNSRSVISQNISEMVHAGHKQSQAVAAALSNARRHPHRPFGGMIPNANASPIGNYFARQALHHLPTTPRIPHMGPIGGSTMGRGDKVGMHVAPGSYVLPADHVSGLGQGNTQAGFKVLNRMFGGPFGAPGMSPHAPHGAGVHMPHLAQGGPGPVEIQAADGEYVVPPEAVMRKFGNLKHGHKMLDAWVTHERAKHVKTLSNLPGPVKN